MRRPIIAGNWKMNSTRQTAVALALAVRAAVPAPRNDIEVVVAPPFPYLADVVAAVRGSAVAVSAQNAWPDAPGAYTGEVACEMLKDVGCAWVILGHSERRQLLGETDALINRKVHKVLQTGLKAMLCVGELLEHREAGRTNDILDGQMTGSLADVTVADLDRIAVAYEPVWAIGTGKVASNDQAESAHAFLRTWLGRRFGEAAAQAVRILYGGSVKADNAAGLLAQPNVDGALVGGASLKAESFIPIIEAAIGAAAN